MFLLFYLLYTLILFAFFALFYYQNMSFLKNKAYFCDFLKNDYLFNFNYLKLKHTNLKEQITISFDVKNNLFPLKEANIY